MSLILPFRFWALVALALASPLVEAQNATMGVPVRLAHAGGLQTSLSTAHSSVRPGPAEATLGGGMRQSPGVRATAAVVNRGRQTVPFGFASESARRRGWYFRLLNEGGGQVWESESQPEAAEEGESAGVTLMLRPGRSLSRTTVVPTLLPNGSPLPAGRYLLEAVLLSDMPLTASTVILVQGTDQPPGGGNRLGVIQGRAVQAVRDENSTMPPAPGYRVTVSSVAVLVRPGPITWPGTGGLDPVLPSVMPPILPPVFFWSGVTGENGEFRAEVPSGEYEVTVEFAGAVAMIYPPPPLWRGSVRVRVAAGNTSETTVVLTLQHPDGGDPGVRPPVLSRFPMHWGPPPDIQTMDIVELPGGYGMGSSTLRHWIQGNLDRDAALSGPGGSSNAVVAP